MTLDDELCLCFHVTRRKLENFVRREQPQVVSQLSQCGGAGTGCGWCIPLLRQLHARQTAALDAVTNDQHAGGRRQHIADGRGTPAG